MHDLLAHNSVLAVSLCANHRHPQECFCGCLQILYSYPEDVPVTPEVASATPFCFPHGVQPVLLERTPSMSALNEVIYSQQYLNSDGASFIFFLKVSSHGMASCCHFML